MPEEIKTEKKTIRKLPSKLFAFVGFSINDGKVTLDDKIVLLKSVDEVLEKIQDPEFMASHKMYTLTHDDLYI